jgi:hypothetical protein
VLTVPSRRPGPQAALPRRIRSFASGWWETTNARFLADKDVARDPPLIEVTRCATVPCLGRAGSETRSRCSGR